MSSFCFDISKLGICWSLFISKFYVDIDNRYARSLNRGEHIDKFYVKFTVDEVNLSVVLFRVLWNSLAVDCGKNETIES